VLSGHVVWYWAQVCGVLVPDGRATPWQFGSYFRLFLECPDPNADNLFGKATRLFGLRFEKGSRDPVLLVNRFYRQTLRGAHGLGLFTAGESVTMADVAAPCREKKHCIACVIVFDRRRSGGGAPSCGREEKGARKRGEWREGEQNATETPRPEFDGVDVVESGIVGPPDNNEMQLTGERGVGFAPVGARPPFGEAVERSRHPSIRRPARWSSVVGGGPEDGVFLRPGVGPSEWI